MIRYSEVPKRPRIGGSGASSEAGGINEGSKNMTTTIPAPRRTLAMALVCASAMLGGCAPGDVQLNGKIFDALGVNSGGGQKEAKVAERAPLVVPPGLERLPAPGSGAEAETGALAEIKDDDENRVATKAELQRQQAEYCKKNYELPKSHGQDVDSVKGPLGDCRPSVFTVLPKVLNSDSGEE